MSKARPIKERRSTHTQGSGLAHVEVCGHETVPPTPDILDALERDYPLEASIADLVDNSIDAHARKVLIRFMRSGGRLVSLCIVDNGAGMASKKLNQAMQFAARRTYGPKDIGMFGVGLKTASLSQAEQLIVVSRANSRPAAGRQWTKSGIKKNAWRLDILAPISAARILERDWGSLSLKRHGTVVRWDHVDDFDRLHSGINEYLEDAKQRIRTHLGLKLHRFLTQRTVKIYIEVEDVDTGEVGPPSQVLPTNPFPEAGASVARGYPKDFVVHFPGAGKVTMRAHIWRKKSKEAGYKLGGGSVAEHQGFYFFRHDRLVQDGGWCGMIGTNEPHMSLARVEVDVPDALQGYLKVRSNKAGVDVPATFGPAVHKAHARDGTRFDDFLRKAEEVYRRRGEQKARPMVMPGTGIPSDVRKALEKRSMRFLRGQKCSVSWEKTKGLGFVHVDQDNRHIVLNSRYRKMLLRGAHGGKTDFPLLRTLLYFVFAELVTGDRIGPVERHRLEAIQSSMNAALKLELKWASD